MAQTFKGAMLRLSWLMQVTSFIPIGGGTLSSDVKHQMFVKPSSVPAPGTAVTAITVQQKSGAFMSLETWIQDYTFNVIRPRYRIAGGGLGDINFGTVTVEFLAEGSEVALFITAYSVVSTGWVSAVSSNVYAQQLIVTFRAQSGRVVKLVYNNGITVPARPVRPPTADAGIQGYFNALTGSTGCVRSRDGSPLVASIGWFAGQNEKLWRDIAR